AVEFFGDAQVFDGQRLLGKSAGKNYRGPATGFEQFVCLGVTNAWAVPVLFKIPDKVDKAPLRKACGSDRTSGDQAAAWGRSKSGGAAPTPGRLLSDAV